MDLRLGKPTALGILATSVIGHLRRFTATTISTAKVGTSPSTSLAATVLVLRAPLSGFASQPLCKVRHVEPLADDLFLDAIPKDGAPIVSARVGVLLKTTEQRQQRGVPAGGVVIGPHRPRVLPIPFILPFNPAVAIEYQERRGAKLLKCGPCHHKVRQAGERLAIPPVASPRLVCATRASPEARRG
jgi:hypothetical protein